MQRDQNTVWVIERFIIKINFMGIHALIKSRGELITNANTFITDQGAHFTTRTHT
jgi:hypothetical protein